MAIYLSMLCVTTAARSVLWTVSYSLAASARAEAAARDVDAAVGRWLGPLHGGLVRYRNGGAERWTSSDGLRRPLSAEGWNSSSNE